MQKIAATNKSIDNVARTAFASHMSQVIFKKILIMLYR